jgi:predicted small lipoprotein YifL
MGSAKVGAFTMMRLTMLAVAAALLAGCGLKGDLETPPPLWGDKDRAITDRDLPSSRGQGNQVVFTRDDVDIFQPATPEEDPFAKDDADTADDAAGNAQSSGDAQSSANAPSGE